MSAIYYNYLFMKIAILVSKYTPKRNNRNMFSKISSWEIPHSKRVSKIFIFYIKNGNFWKKNKDKIWSKYTLKRTKLHCFKKFSRGSMPPNPLAKPCAACRFATCKFLNLKKKILAPPPPKSWGRPWKVPFLEFQGKWKYIYYIVGSISGEPTSIEITCT